MKKIMRYIENQVRIKYPLIHLALFQKPRAHFRFRNERALMKGQDISKSHNKSFIFFTAHKCASVHISKNLKTLSENADMTHVNFDSYFSSTDDSKYKLFSNTKFLKNSFKKQGYYYGPFRSFRNIPNMEDFAVLLVLRDLRDVLTSNYYSVVYSHSINRKVLLARKEAREMSVDEYVLHVRHQFKETYETYCNELLKMPNTLFLKYEDMVMDFESWLNKLAIHINLDSDELLLQRIISEASFEVDKENVYSHKRQVMPGDHKRKLKPETIEVLNADFKDILEKLGYPQ